MLNLGVTDSAVEKMSRLTFMEKLPKTICEAMAIVDYEKDNVVEIAQRVKNMRMSMKWDFDEIGLNKMQLESENHRGNAGYSGDTEQNMEHGYGNIGYAGYGYGNGYGNMGYSGNNYSGYYNSNQYANENRNGYGYWNENGHGYQVYCWNCGAAGHRQSDCNFSQNNMEYNQLEIEQGPVVEEPKDSEQAKKDEEKLFNSLFE